MRQSHFARRGPGSGAFGSSLAAGQASRSGISGPGIAVRAASLPSLAGPASVRALDEHRLHNGPQAIKRQPITAIAMRGGGAVIGGLMGYILTQALRRTEWNQRRRIVSRLRKPPQALEEFKPGPLFLPRAGKVSFLLDHLNSDPSGPLVITGPSGSGKTMLAKRALCDRPHSVYISLRATPCSSGEALSQVLVTQAGYLMPPNELLSRAIFNREASATTMTVELDKAFRVITEVLVNEKKRGWFVKGGFISQRFNRNHPQHPAYHASASSRGQASSSPGGDGFAASSPTNDLPLVLPPVIVIDELNAGEISNGLLDDSQFWRLVDWSMHLGDNRLAHVVFSCGLEVADLLDAFPGFRMRRNRVHFDFPRVGTVQDYFLNVVNPFMRDVLGAQQRGDQTQAQAQTQALQPPVQPVSPQASVREEEASAAAAGGSAEASPSSTAEADAEAKGGERKPAADDDAAASLSTSLREGRAPALEASQTPAATASTTATEGQAAATSAQAATTSSVQEEEEAAADQLTSTSSSSPSAPMAALRPPEPAAPKLKSKSGAASNSGDDSAAKAKDQAASAGTAQASDAAATAAASTGDSAAAGQAPLSGQQPPAQPASAASTTTTSSATGIPLEDQQLLPPYLPPPQAQQQQQQQLQRQQLTQQLRSAAAGSSIYDQTAGLYVLEPWEVRRIVDVVGGHLKDIDAIVSAMVRGRHWAAALERLVAGSCDLVERSLDDILTAVVDPGAGPVAGSSPGIKGGGGSGGGGGGAISTAAYLGRAGTRGGASVILRSARGGTGLANKNSLTAPPPFDFNVDPSPQRLAVYCRYLRGMALISECAQRKYTPRRDVINRIFAECPQELEHFMDLGLVMSVNLRGTIKMGGATHASATLTLNQAGMSVGDTTGAGAGVGPGDTSSSPSLTLPGTYIAASSPRMRVAFKVLAADPKLQAQTQRIAAVVALQTLRREERFMLAKLGELSNQRKVVFDTLSMLVGRETSLRTSVIKDVMSWGSPAVGALLTGKPPVPTQIPVLPVAVPVPMGAASNQATAPGVGEQGQQQQQAGASAHVTNAAAAAGTAAPKQSTKDDVDDDEDYDEEGRPAKKKPQAQDGAAAATTAAASTTPPKPVPVAGSTTGAGKQPTPPTTGLGATVAALQPSGYYASIPTPQQLYDMAVAAARTGQVAGGSAALSEALSVEAGHYPHSSIGGMMGFGQQPYVLPANLAGFSGSSSSPAPPSHDSSGGGISLGSGGHVNVPLESYSTVSLLGNPRLSSYLESVEQALMRCDGQLASLGKKLEQLRYAMMLAQRRCEVPLPETDEWVGLVRSAQISRVLFSGGGGSQGGGGGGDDSATPAPRSPASGSSQPSPLQAQNGGASKGGEAGSPSAATTANAATTATAAAVVAPASDRYYYSSSSSEQAADPVQWQSLASSTSSSSSPPGDDGTASASSSRESSDRAGAKLGRHPHHHHHHVSNGHRRASPSPRVGSYGAAGMMAGAGASAADEDPALFRLQQEHASVDDAWYRYAQEASQEHGVGIGGRSAASSYAQRRENINRRMMAEAGTTSASPATAAYPQHDDQEHDHHHDDDSSPAAYGRRNHPRQHRSGGHHRHPHVSSPSQEELSSASHYYYDDETATDALSDARDESQYQQYQQQYSSNEVPPSPAPTQSQQPRPAAPTYKRAGSRVVGRGAASISASPASPASSYDARGDGSSISATAAYGYGYPASAARTALQAASAAHYPSSSPSSSYGQAGGEGARGSSSTAPSAVPDEHAYVHTTTPNEQAQQGAAGAGNARPRNGLPVGTRPGGYRWWL